MKVIKSLRKSSVWGGDHRSVTPTTHQYFWLLLPAWCKYKHWQALTIPVLCVCVGVCVWKLHTRRDEAVGRALIVCSQRLVCCLLYSEISETQNMERNQLRIEGELLKQHTVVWSNSNKICRGEAMEAPLLSTWNAKLFAKQFRCGSKFAIVSYSVYLADIFYTIRNYIKLWTLTKRCIRRCVNRQKVISYRDRRIN